MPRASSWRDGIDPRRVGWMRPLLVFVPAAAVAWMVHAPAPVQFGLAALAIVPLAGLIGAATESLARRLGPGVGSLLNATFGNAAELIIALFALFRGLDGMVKASLTGSIIGNLLLVLGASLLAGGTKHAVQRFNRTAAGVGATLLVLAASGLLVPALFDRLVAPGENPVEHKLSLAVSVVLMVAYALSLVFALVTHKNLFNPADEDGESALHEGPRWGARRSTAYLVIATGLVALMSEVLVGAVEKTSAALGLTEVFVGVIVVAIVGNAAEHSTAVLMALKNQMDLAVGIALGSALQIALFVAPVLVFVSHARTHPMDLVFTPLEVVAVILAVVVARMVAEDGESNWLEGAMLLLIYAILGIAFFYLPAPKEAGNNARHGTTPLRSQTARGLSSTVRQRSPSNLRIEFFGHEFDDLRGRALDDGILQRVLEMVEEHLLVKVHPQAGWWLHAILSISDQGERRVTLRLFQSKEFDGRAARDPAFERDRDDVGHRKVSSASTTTAPGRRCRTKSLSTKPTSR